MLSNNREDLNSIGILVKNNSNFSSFEDLKGAKACFTEYKSIGKLRVFSTKNAYF